MLCIYYETLCRTQEYTEFLVQPLEACQYAVDGLVHCRGKVSVYQRKVPLELTGGFDPNGNFIVTKACIPDPEIKEGKSLLLDYLGSSLTCTQKKKLSGRVMDLTVEMLSGAKVQQEKAGSFLKRRKEFMEERKLIHILEACKVEGDSIEHILNRKLSLQMLTRDPYKACLYNDLDIYTADRIAKRVLHIHPYAPIRLIGFVRDAMALANASGDTCTTFHRLLEIVNYRVKKSEYKDTVFNLALIYYCVREGGYITDVIDDQIYVYEKRIYEEEKSIAENIHRLQSSRRALGKPDITKIENQCGLNFNQSQRKAFQAIETTGVKIITGPPGTGKTAFIRGITEERKRVRLAATTGRASQVLSRATGKEAVTVHKMLDIRPFGDNITSKDINNPVDADMVVVDEASMMGAGLAARLFDAIKNDTTLILVGDEDQLQSVEYGNVLHDLIQSGKVEVYRLDEVMRYKGTLMENSIRIRQGCYDMIQDQSFQVLEFQNDAQALDALLERKEHGSHVLTTVRGGLLGTCNLNRLLQEKDSTYCMSYGKNDYYAGNPVIMGRTNYDKGYFNGDIGYVKGKSGQGILVQFTSRTICLEREDLAVTDLAYAVTVHKSQGDEYDNVHILLPASVPGMLIRRLINTAVTRAKKKVTVYSINGSFMAAVKNGNEKNRLTNVIKRINEGGLINFKSTILP